MPFRAFVFTAVLLVPVAPAVADDLLYRYEGDVVPYDESAGWVIADPCEDECSESIEDGHFALYWSKPADLANYHYWISFSPEEAPPSLWVEWRFRSDRLLDDAIGTCDAKLSVSYRQAHEVVFMYGDAALSFSGDEWVTGLDIHQFHTYRFESFDGANYWVAADGSVFIAAWDDESPGAAYMQLRGRGGCSSDEGHTVNEWDFVRFGTISYGEQIVASDPPPGFLDAREHAALHRFTVTFEQPNYVYIDEITVEVIDVATSTSSLRPSVPSSLPVVTHTRRRENDEADTVEIVLDRPIPMGETTRFIFNDGVAVNVIEYTFVPGVTDGTGRVDLRDLAVFQGCFGSDVSSGPCLACDLDGSGTIELTDFAEFRNELIGP